MIEGVLLTETNILQDPAKFIPFYVSERYLPLEGVDVYCIQGEQFAASFG